MKSSHQGKDVKFKKQYIITFEGVSKMNPEHPYVEEEQTFMENTVDSIMGVVVATHNGLHKTTKMSLEIIKIK